MDEMFHINPETGNVGSCSAKQGNCPFGEIAYGVETHYDDLEEARANAEWIMAEKHKNYNVGLSKKKSVAAEPKSQSSSAAPAVTPDRVKNLIASFEVKSPYSGSMQKTYRGGIGEFVRQISKNHRGGVMESGGYRPVSTAVGKVLFKSKTDTRVEFEIDGKPYAIDRKVSERYTEYSDPYPLS